MRLIDADALLEILQSSSGSWAKGIQAIRNWWPHAVKIKDNIVSLIKVAPTIEAEYVKHGRWVEVHRTPFGSSAYRCSVCEGYMPFYNGYKYCPNCGAKMDGGADHD